MVFGDLFGPQQRSRPSFNAKDKEHLYSAQKGKCNGCGVKFPARNMTVDHIRPFSKGGSDKPSNLQLLCGSCNSMKGDGTQAQLKKKLEAKGIIKSSARTATTGKATAKKTATTSKAKPAKRAAPKKRTTRKPRDPFADLFDL